LAERYPRDSAMPESFSSRRISPLTAMGLVVVGYLLLLVFMYGFFASPEPFRLMVLAPIYIAVVLLTPLLLFSPVIVTYVILFRRHRARMIVAAIGQAVRANLPMATW